MKTGLNIRARADGRYEARYEKGRTKDNKIIYGYCYGRTYEEAQKKREAAIGILIGKNEQNDAPRRMNLLILGAGGQGQVLRDVAESLGVFHRIAFLDDDLQKPFVIGVPGDCLKMVNEFPVAIPSVGDGALRARWMQMLSRAGFVIPTLISPTATVSSSAVIGYGTLIEPRVTVGALAHIGCGCILSSGAVVGRGAILADYVHLDCGETLKSKKRL